MAVQTTKIAGLPATKFINRRVRLTNQHGGGHRKTATLISIASKGKVEVKPDQHKGTDIVDADSVHPWWSQNPDLKALHDALVEAGKADEVVEEPEDEEVEEAPTPEPEPEPEDPNPLPPMPAVSVQAGVNPEVWIDKVNELRETMRDEAEVRAMLAPVLDKKKAIARKLKNLGVTVTWEE